MVDEGGGKHEAFTHTTPGSVTYWAMRADRAKLFLNRGTIEPTGAD